MLYRQFGKTSLVVSEVGFGCARIGGVFQRSTSAELLRLLRSSYDAGITFYDSADMYTHGESERLLGQAFRKDRAQLVFATKVGYKLPPQNRPFSRIKAHVKPFLRRLGPMLAARVPAGVRGSVSAQDFSREYIVSALEGSLRRLGTDYIDLYQLHSPPTEVLRAGDYVSIMEDLQQAGKIRYWGVACEQADDALICLQAPSISAVQIAVNYLHPTPLDFVVPEAGRRGVAVIARQVYASGLLTRPLQDVNHGDLDAEPEASEQKAERLAEFARMVEESGRDRIELALDFVLSHQQISVALLGMSTERHLAANLTSLQRVRVPRVESRD